MKLVSLHEAQSNLASIMDAARTDHVIVEQDGQAVGVILSLEEYQDWAGMSEYDLTNTISLPELQAKLRRADAAYAAGYFVEHEELGRRLMAQSEKNG